MDFIQNIRVAYYLLALPEQIRRLSTSSKIAVAISLLTFTLPLLPVLVLFLIFIFLYQIYQTSLILLSILIKRNYFAIPSVHIVLSVIFLKGVLPLFPVLLYPRFSSSPALVAFAKYVLWWYLALVLFLLGFRWLRGVPVMEGFGEFAKAIWKSGKRQFGQLFRDLEPVWGWLRWLGAFLLITSHIWPALKQFGTSILEIIGRVSTAIKRAWNFLFTTLKSIWTFILKLPAYLRIALKIFGSLNFFFLVMIIYAINILIWTPLKWIYIAFMFLPKYVWYGLERNPGLPAWLWWVLK